MVVTGIINQNIVGVSYFKNLELLIDKMGAGG